jgi:hypothetical protein
MGWVIMRNGVPYCEFWGGGIVRNGVYEVRPFTFSSHNTLTLFAHRPNVPSWTEKPTQLVAR